MVYRVQSIGSLFEKGPSLPAIDPSWLPPGTIQAPDGSIVPAPPAPSSAGVSLGQAATYAAIGAIAGAAIVLILRGRKTKRQRTGR